MTPAARQLVVTLGMRHSTGQARLTMATVELRAAFARLMALAWALGRLEHAEEVTPHKSADALRCGPRGAGFEGRPEGMSMAKKRRTNRYGKGTVEWIAGCWWAKVSVQGHRERYKLEHKDGRPLDDRERDKPLALKLAAEISRRARAAALEEQRQERAARLTVRQFGELWTSGKLYEQHGQVKGLRPLRSDRNNRYRLEAYVYPEIGELRVEAVRETDIERVMRTAAVKAERKLGRPWRQASRRQLYQLLRRLFDLARRPGRLREDNPVGDHLRPVKDTAKLFGFLYPSELVAVLGCTAIPVARRVLYALAVYTGLRKGSLYALTWAGVDFHHRTLTSLHSKTGLPQLFELPAGLVGILEAWHRYQGQPEGEAAIVGDVGTYHIEIGKGDEARMVERHAQPDREAEALRIDLEAAGVKRFAVRAPNIEPLRFHDLRATFVTWAMREGRGDGWISDRTGHLTPEMRARYARQARVLADLQYEPFPDISEAIPELVNLPDNVRKLPRRRTP